MEHVHRRHRPGAGRLASLFLAGGAGVPYLSQATYWTLGADIGGASAGSVSGS